MRIRRPFTQSSSPSTTDFFRPEGIEIELEQEKEEERDGENQLEIGKSSLVSPSGDR